MVEYVGSQTAGRVRRRRETADVASFVRALDWVLIASVGALIGFGLWGIAGITRHDVPGSPNYYVTRQAIFVAVGVVALIATVVIDPSLYRHRWRAILGLAAAAIAFVYLEGQAVRGSHRWVDLGFFRFQPSEFGKVLFVVALAGFLAERTKRLNESRTILSALGLAAIPVVLVFLQPDFGTAMVYVAALGAALFIAGVRWLHVVTVGFGVVFAALLVLWLLPAGGMHLLAPYQADRLTGFLHPDSDPRGTTYNITQSKNAIGAGQLRGRGVEGATQTTLNFLPEHATDFVFASFAEERGFVGCAILLALYLLVVWRGLRVVTLARDPFSAIVAGALVFALVFQIFVNVGMTMGIAPITGIPLPFMSVGGSSMITNLIGVGLLLGIHARARRRR
jgi:rod shape determining protein RodA